MTIYGAHRLPETFPEPEEYQPQRWLDLDARRRMEPYFIPFSAGARGCIGRNITYLEQVVVLASLVSLRVCALVPRVEAWKTRSVQSDCGRNAQSRFGEGIWRLQTRLIDETLDS